MFSNLCSNDVQDTMLVCREMGRVMGSVCYWCVGGGWVMGGVCYWCVGRWGG